MDYIKDRDFPGVKHFDPDYPRSNGVIATKDNRIISWSILSANVLKLETADTEQCYLLYIDKWTQEAIDELKKYQYSNQAGRKRYTRSSEERMALLEINLSNLTVRVEDELKTLEKSYADFQIAPEDKKRIQFNAFVRKRILVESLRNRIINIEKELIPLKLEIQYPTRNYGFGTSSNMSW